MELDKQTIEIISSLKTINPGLVFKAGNVLKARHFQAEVPIVKVMFASVNFPQDFAVYDIGKLLSINSLFTDPEISFDQENYVTLSDGVKRSASIRLTDPSMINHFSYEKEVRMPDADIEFTLEESDLKYLLKAAGAFNTPEFVIKNAKGKMIISTNNSNNPSVDAFEIEVGETDKSFNIIVEATYLQLLIRSYKVKVSFKGLLEFTSENEHNTLQYWITASQKSKVG
jgi:hypothetical protein